MLRWQELENGEWVLFDYTDKELYRVNNEEQMTAIMDFAASPYYISIIDMDKADVRNHEGRKLVRRMVRSNDLYPWEVEW